MSRIIAKTGFNDPIFSKENQKRASLLKRDIQVNSRNPNLPDEYIPIPGNLELNISNDFIALFKDTFFLNSNGKDINEFISGLCTLNYPRYIQNSTTDYITSSELDNDFLVSGNSLFNVTGSHRETIEGSQYERVKGDYRMTIQGSEYLNIAKDFEEIIEGVETTDVRKNFMVSVRGPNFVYTRGDEILDIGGEERTTVVGSQKYYIGGSDSVTTIANSTTNVKKDWDDDISGNQVTTVNSDDLIEIGGNSKNIVDGILSINVSNDQNISILGNKEELINQEYNLTTSLFNIESDVKLVGELNTVINGELNLININGGVVTSGQWLPIPWSSFNITNNPGVVFDQINNKFIIEKDGNYSFSSFVEFNLPNATAVTRIRCNDKILLGSSINRYLTTSFIGGTSYIKKQSCVYFEYISSTSSLTGFGSFEPNKILSSLTITKL